MGPSGRCLYPSEKQLERPEICFCEHGGEEAAMRAIQGSNGSWIGDRKIASQKAMYGKERISRGVKT